MAVSELGGISEIEGWTQPQEAPRLQRIVRGVVNFARKKPLGFICGCIVIFFVIIGDFVPETVNKISSTAGFGTPVPYLADQLDKALPFVMPYAKQDLRARLQPPSADHLLGTDSI